jgi:hypothetical protein
VPAGRPGRAPRLASGCDETGGAGPVGCAGWVGEEKGGLTRGVHLPVTKGEGKGGRAVYWAERGYGLGRLPSKGG